MYMIEHILLEDYFNLSKKDRDDVMKVVADNLMDAYYQLEKTWGSKRAKNILYSTLSKEQKNAINEENYEYCEIVKELTNRIEDAFN